MNSKELAEKCKSDLIAGMYAVKGGYGVPTDMLPMGVREAEGLSEVDVDIAKCDQLGMDLLPDEERLPNVRFIVRAVNCHDELVGACKLWLAYENAVAEEPGINDGPLAGDRILALARIQAEASNAMYVALAKATGGIK